MRVLRDKFLEIASLLQDPKSKAAALLVSGLMTVLSNPCS
jgi:hypothetical protein